MGYPRHLFQVTARGRRLRKGPTVTVVAIAALVMLAAGNPVGYAAPVDAPSAGSSLWATSYPADVPAGIPAAVPASAGTWIGIPAAGSLAPDPTEVAPVQLASSTSNPTFRPLAIATPGPALKGEWIDPGRPLPDQSSDWLALKAAGRIALVDGKITVLSADANPLVGQSTGQAVPDQRMLDTTWTRWIIEVPGVGRDEKGTYYRDINYWELCGTGAMTVALWYWQQQAGYPDVTGKAGYFLEPYEAQGTWWPMPGPRLALSGRTKLGTYWSGSDHVGGSTAHGRGFQMYLAMSAQPATWKSPGFAVFAQKGKPLYPTVGTSRSNIQAGLNWEVSGHDSKTWATAYYTSVVRTDATLGRDLKAAVMLDVGRDGVPVVATVDSYYLPNWQDGANTPHTGHAISIVGYDNTANPPTYTYIETCGHSCNQRPRNHDGELHVMPQSLMVVAMRYMAGAGFVW